MKRSGKPWRIIYYDDTAELFVCGAGDMRRETVEGWVDQLAGTQVDALSWIAGIPDVCYFDTREGEVFGAGHESFNASVSTWSWQVSENVKSMIRSGNDPMSVICERCHHHGIDFLAVFRMNDEHAIAKEDDPLSSRFLLDHLDWRVPGRRGALDYSIKEVRDHRFNIIQEAAEGYDIDGIELDWMRWGVMFPKGREREKAPILTEFVRRIRKMLDRVAQKKGKDRLLLGTRVAPTVAATEEMGIDLKAWLAEGLLDYLCPSDFYYTDFNMPVETFRELTQGTPCTLYPSVHPMRSSEDTRPLTEAHLRAAAHNYYAGGADGISMYNFFVGQLSLPDSYMPSPLIRESWHIAMNAIREIGDPELIAGKDRHYEYYPMWPVAWPERGGPGSRCDSTLLSRTELGKREVFRFRIMEDLTAPDLSAQLRFKVVNMTMADVLEVDLNGTPIPMEQFVRTHWGRGRSYGTERRLFPWVQFDLPLTAPPARTGDNEIGFRVMETAPRISFDMWVEEVEAKVAVAE
ncbi:MAG: hypothetical protein KAJ05_03100 [Candidatus Latescibacteria bacterium]|nr:hypothetical protein [Candidatus Latescibacterota bacterium]